MSEIVMSNDAGAVCSECSEQILPFDVCIVDYSRFNTDLAQWHTVCKICNHHAQESFESFCTFVFYNDLEIRSLTNFGIFLRTRSQFV